MNLKLSALGSVALNYVNGFQLSVNTVTAYCPPYFNYNC